MDVNRIISHYIALRDRKEEIEARHKEELAPIKENMQKIETALQQVMMDQGGVTNIKGSAGTAFLEYQVSTKVVDWQSVIQYIKDNDRWEVLDRRVNKTAAQETDIPGVEVVKFPKVRVRRK